MSGALRVLVVDDDPVSRLVMTHMLERLGHDVLPADDAPTARQIASAGIDLVLSDYCLPGANGDELFAHLRDDGHEVPLVLVTGVAQMVGIGDAADARLTKPLDSRRLAACLEEVLGRGA